jgi:hypothetical protein
MKKKILLACFFFIVLVVAFFFSIKLFIVLLSFSLLFLIMILFLFTCNMLVKRTNWYKNIFIYQSQFITKQAEFHEDLQRNYDIVNLGSNPPRFAFFYEHVLGQNWSTGIQGLAQDFLILKRYYSYIKSGGIVLIPILPLSAIYTYSLKYKPERNLLTYHAKFVRMLDHYQVYKQPYYRNASLFIRFPLLMYPSSLLYLLHDTEKDDRLLLSEQIMQPLELNKDADSFVESWKENFDIEDFEAPLSDIHKESIAESVAILSEMIDFCIERDLKPVLIIPPVTRYMSACFSESVREQFMYDFIRRANKQNIPLLDYYTDARFQDPQLYFNSFFLNLKGRKLFTKQVLKDLNIPEYL